MTIKRKPKQRVYYLSDLAAIAEQLGGRIQFQIVPKEIFDKQRRDDEATDVTSSKS